MSKVADRLEPGESVALELRLQIGVDNPDWHWYTPWRSPFIYREPTPQELKKLQAHYATKTAQASTSSGVPSPSKVGGKE